MPNGGSDCCGTCWFNRANGGRPGFASRRPDLPDHCEIRDLALRVPFYTYCANHPHHTGKRIPVPIGPVYTGDGFGDRNVWVESPDTEEIRLGLLHLLENPDELEEAYPFYSEPVPATVMKQLAVFRERRAIPIIQRIIAQLDAQGEESDGFRRMLALLTGESDEPVF